jgi:hypothetical protein
MKFNGQKILPVSFSNVSENFPVKEVEKVIVGFGFSAFAAF